MIIAEDVDGEALSTLVVNRIRGTFASCAVKAPAFGDRRKAILEDLAVLTGGQVISSDIGLKLDSVGLEVLGTARRVVVSKDNTTIVEGGGSAQAVADRVAQIRSEVERSDSDWDREKLQERLAKIVGGVVVIKVGGHTEVELKERSIALKTPFLLPVPRSKKALFPVAEQHSFRRPRCWMDHWVSPETKQRV